MEKLLIYILGCRKHEEIANRGIALIHKNLQCSKRIVFVTDYQSDYQDAFNVDSIVYCGDDSYSQRIQRSLTFADSDYVLLLLDDYYISKEINDNRLSVLIDSMKANKLSYCKLIGKPKCRKKFKPIKGARLISRKTHYGISLQPSIWKTSVITDILSNAAPGNAWQTEVALFDTNEVENGHCITFNKNFLNYKNGVLRGKLFPYTNKVLKKNGLEPLNLERISYVKYWSFSLRQSVSSHLPYFLRNLFKKIGRKFGKNYYSK